MLEHTSMRLDDSFNERLVDNRGHPNLDILEPYRSQKLTPLTFGHV